MMNRNRLRIGGARNIQYTVGGSAHERRLWCGRRRLPHWHTPPARDRSNRHGNASLSETGCWHAGLGTMARTVLALVLLSVDLATVSLAVEQ